MKKRISSFLCALLLIVSLPGVITAAEAATQASAYFGFTDVRAYAEGGGEILIEIDVNATNIMLEVGASDVHIYEQQSNGKYQIVYTFEKDDYPSMVETNSAFGCVDVYYQGVSGRKYYALVGCYAKDSEGAETRYYTTNSVTA